MDNQNQANNNISCCFTGHRPEHLPWGRAETRQDYLDYYLKLCHATEEMIEAGCRIFYCGMARGVDTMAAQIVLGLREARPELGLKLIAVCPHADQASFWGAKDKQMHAFLLSMADEVVTIEPHYTPSCFHRRNRFMVDRSDYVIAGFDGVTKGGTASTVAYARRRCKRILTVSPA
jgi:uncharacterized phage-like protein YoqJ